MAIAELKAKTVNAKLWLPIEEMESEALTQIRNVASLPWAFHVSVMPDAHYGKGTTVGSVIALKKAVSPSCVGVDIGCGMAALKTNMKAEQLPDSLSALRTAIEAAVPVGFSSHGNNRKFPKAFKTGQQYKNLRDLFENSKELHPKVENMHSHIKTQLGTLGGGNHFLEICLDENKNVWIMLHSGSRRIGKELADIHINIAKKLTHNNNLPDPDLAVFLSSTPEMEAYRRDLMWAQEYARLNREVMLEIVKGVMSKLFPFLQFENTVQCHHNYVSEEIHFGENVFVTRKGAISAKKGEMGIIPGSMGAKSFIVRGLGNPESLSSASHGAGRRMSRGKAKKRFTEEDLLKQTEGVECRKDRGVLDEIPGAYKDIDKVIDRQKDLVEIVATLKQVLCVKG